MKSPSWATTCSIEVLVKINSGFWLKMLKASTQIILHPQAEDCQWRQINSKFSIIAPLWNKHQTVPQQQPIPYYIFSSRSSFRSQSSCLKMARSIYFRKIIRKRLSLLQCLLNTLPRIKTPSTTELYATLIVSSPESASKIWLSWLKQTQAITRPFMWWCQ